MKDARWTSLWCISLRIPKQLLRRLTPLAAEGLRNWRRRQRLTQLCYPLLQLLHVWRLHLDNDLSGTIAEMQKDMIQSSGKLTANKRDKDHLP